MDRNFWLGLSGVWRFLVNAGDKRGILADRKEPEMKSKIVEESLQAIKMTKEEKKINTQLIQECRERERRLDQYRRDSEEGIKILMAHLNHLAIAIELIDEHLREANDRLAEVILRHMPDSEIPHT